MQVRGEGHLGMYLYRHFLWDRFDEQATRSLLYQMYICICLNIHCLIGHWNIHLYEVLYIRLSVCTACIELNFLRIS